uniref:Protein SDA1 n=1 Tax=Steinernema glaseri TaxID=37863 RepID=A0A1I7Z2T5_9BILA
MSSISPLKRFSARNASRSLFASPEKPIREITLTNVSCLIEQEEKESDEEEEEVVEDMFMDETQVIEEENPGRLELEAKWNSKRTNDGTFKPRAKKDNFRTNDGTFKPRAKKDNFVRLNMRKKTFVRGQMSASAKRKKLFRHKRKGF